jgi:hypothetical protein
VNKITGMHRIAGQGVKLTIGKVLDLLERATNKSQRFEHRLHIIKEEESFRAIIESKYLNRSGNWRLFEIGNGPDISASVIS